MSDTQHVHQHRDDLGPYLMLPDEESTPTAVYHALRDAYGTLIAWYLHEKVGKGRRSRALRASSLCLGILGGLVPLISVIVPRVNSSLGYLLLAVAAGTVVFDRYFGYSAAWARYMLTAARLNSALVEFQIEWLALQGGDVAAEDSCWALLHEYGVKMASFVEEETAEWAGVFNEATADLNSRLHPGGIGAGAG